MRLLPFHPAIEGLRGLAVVAVLLFHGEVPGVGGGFLGVSTFFTLSGFLITGLLTARRERDDRIRLRAFWARRFRRLMPAALIGLVGIAVLAASFGSFDQHQRIRLDGLSALLYLANWWLIASGAAYADLMGAPSFIQHFWSLAIEEQYYAVFPLVAAMLLALRRRAPLAAVLAVGTIASWLWMNQLAGSAASTPRIYYGTDTRCGELLIGGVLALAITGRELSDQRARLLAWAGPVGLAVSAVLWTVATVQSPWLYQWGIPLYAIASVALVAGCVAPAGPVRRALSWEPIRFIGRVSYGAYVYHWPIFLVVDARTGLDPVSLFALRVALTFAVAALSYRFIEEPILSGRLITGWQRWLVPPLAFLSVGFVVYNTVPGIQLPDLPDRPAPLAEGAPRVAVLGDSVARDIGWGLEMWASRTGDADVLNLAVGGCGLAVGAWPDAIGRQQVGCDRWRERAATQLAPFHPDVIVIATTVWELNDREHPDWGEPLAMGDPRFDAWILSEFRSTAKFFEQFSAPVVWVNAPCLQRLDRKKTGAFEPARVRHMNETILPQVVSTSPNVVAVADLYGAVCPRGRFRNSFEGISPFRKDGVHFSPRGQHWIGEWLGPQVVEAWRRTPDS